jgi:hypothetical protein
MILPNWMTVSLSPRERVRVRGNGAFYVNQLKTSTGTVELRESSGRAGWFPK